MRQQRQRTNLQLKSRLEVDYSCLLQLHLKQISLSVAGVVGIAL